MLTSQAPSFSQWKQALRLIGLKEAHITDDIAGILSAYGFTPTSITDESFQGYYSGESECAAGITVAKEFSSLNTLQEFLHSAIDWEQAWKSLKLTEGYILLKVKEANTWALFAR